jgi:hypothetical protein
MLVGDAELPKHLRPAPAACPTFAAEVADAYCLDPRDLSPARADGLRPRGADHQDLRAVRAALDLGGRLADVEAGVVRPPLEQTRRKRLTSSVADMEVLNCCGYGGA